nr:hypothetical protein WMHIBSEC_WMHIBSEC_CDS_0025 [Caudoviricetes sp.]CAI9751709.1 hypothetical protein AZFZUZMX_AZFZUZMX_CDS_0025 [Caudoviricetes sp.]
MTDHPSFSNEEISSLKSKLMSASGLNLRHTLTTFCFMRNNLLSQYKGRK